MSRKESKPRVDIYAKITDRIVADLEKGVRPWVKPWSAGNIRRVASHGRCATTVCHIRASIRCFSGRRQWRGGSSRPPG